MPIGPEDVLAFWFPPGLDRDAATHLGQVAWWFRGGADAAIVERFQPLLAAAKRGELDGWAATPRGRLALIIVLDQFSRSIFKGRAEAWEADEKALGLALAGLERGEDRKLAAVWERTFFCLPLGHSERLDLQDRSVALTEAMARDAPPELTSLYEYAVGQARGHRDVIARFGRHPHRNAALGRASTPEELDYLAEGKLVHERPLPS
jgi:uncharacterized protein (DUF924 family)